MEPTDAELIAAVLKGDTASFEPLVQRHIAPGSSPALSRYAWCDSEVEDIVQEVWLKSSGSFGSFAAKRRSSTG